jgi:hypothetical protein
LIPRLGKPEIHTWQLGQSRIHPVNQPLFVSTPLPVWFQAYAALDVGGSEWVHAVVGAAQLGNNVGDLREFTDSFAQFVGHLRGFGQGYPRRQLYL